MAVPYQEVRQRSLNREQDCVILWYVVRFAAGCDFGSTLEAHGEQVSVVQVSHGHGAIHQAMQTP